MFQSYTGQRKQNMVTKLSFHVHDHHYITIVLQCASNVNSDLMVISFLRQLENNTTSELLITLNMASNGLLLSTLN